MLDAWSRLGLASGRWRSSWMAHYAFPSKSQTFSIMGPIFPRMVCPPASLKTGPTILSSAKFGTPVDCSGASGPYHTRPLQQGQIGNRRIPDAREKSIDGPFGFFEGEAICGAALCKNITDRRDYYHQAAVTDARARSNMLPFCFTDDELAGCSGLQLASEAEAASKGRRSQAPSWFCFLSRVVCMLSIPLPGRPFGGWVCPSSPWVFGLRAGITVLGHAAFPLNKDVEGLVIDGSGESWHSSFQHVCCKGSGRSTKYLWKTSAWGLHWERHWLCVCLQSGWRRDHIEPRGCRFGPVSCWGPYFKEDCFVCFEP